jgi:DNA-binding response OmpR family regulator
MRHPEALRNTTKIHPSFIKPRYAELLATHLAGTIGMRLLLVEDEADLAIAIAKSLRHHKYVVDWVEQGQLAWECLRSGDDYNLAIVDWMMPGMSGIELCQQLRASHNPIPVLMLTARDQLADRVTGLDAGADDYLVKPFGMAELLARIRALLRRPSQIQAPILQTHNLTLDYQTYTLSAPNLPAQSLTAKEFQLLEYFMQHPQQILSHDQIRSRLWDMRDESISNVVAAQIRLLRRKLAACGHPNAIETLRGLGYRFQPEG